MRFSHKTKIAIIASIFLAGFAVTGLVVAVYIQSVEFQEKARDYVVRQLAQRTGCRVELQALRWDIRRGRIELDELVLHGAEASNEPPLARLPRIEIGLNIRSLFARKVDVDEIILANPQFHFIFDTQGKPNLRVAKGDSSEPQKWEVAIARLQIANGLTIVNERQIETDFFVRNLESEMSFQSRTGILSGRLKYDGTYDRTQAASIPYRFEGQMDFTHGTLLPHSMSLQSGGSALQLQGRIDDLFNDKIKGHLEYSGHVEVPFLNYFFPEEKFSGSAAVSGALNFAAGYFVTDGKANADSISYDAWPARLLRTDYSYRYPEKRAAFKNLDLNSTGGKIAGSVTVENLPGPTHVVLGLKYSGIHGPSLERLYPWDRKYRLDSTVTGTLNGWFEGKFDRFALSGHAGVQPLAASSPTSDHSIVPLRLDGGTDFVITPGQARLSNASGQFESTHIKAEGLIDRRNSNLSLSIDSANLHDAYFIDPAANGLGTFIGTLTGAVAKPVLDGNFTLQNYATPNWTLQSSRGHVTVTTATETAVLDDVHVLQGRSEIVLNGNTGFKAMPVDIRIRADNLQAEDLQSFVQQKIRGVLSGTLRLTSVRPVQVEGDVQADALQINDKIVGNAHSHLRYYEPVIELSSLTISRNGSSLSGNLSVNRANEALQFSARVASVDFASLRWLGLPVELDGKIVQAVLTGAGTLKQPDVRGNAAIENLRYKTETFPQVRVDITSSGPTVRATANAGSVLTLTAQIDAETKSHPFSATANFSKYSLERLAGLPQARLEVTGTATMSGLLTDASALHGEGRIESASARVQDKNFETVSPFTFNFDKDHLQLSNVTLAGEGTQGTISGTIGLTSQAPLNLDVRGQFDLALLAAKGDWTPSGRINVDGRVRGTADNPDLRGVAHLANASISKHGLFTSLTDVNGDLSFDENRVTLTGVKGQLGGGSMSVQGVAVLRRAAIDSVNLLVNANSVRFRYPEGVRTVIDGSVAIRGPFDSPVMDGNLKIQSLSYRSSFEEMVSMFGSIGGGPVEASPLNRVRLAVHVEGGRNITIQNQLASVEARVDLDIRGTVEKPALTGHIEASGGTISFQGKKYTVTRGNVNFVDPVKIEPVVDIQAETDIRNYRIILAITGKGEHLRFDTRSDPPLSQIEVVNLIAGGKSREELAQQGTNITEEQLFKGSAASILSDLVQQRIGGSAFQRLGIGGVRIGPDPLIVSAQNQTTLRVTIEQQVSKDLAVTYSRDLSSNKEEIIQIEYFVGKNMSIIASKDELDYKGLDVKFRKRFK